MLPGRRARERTGDVTRPRVDRLDVTGVPLGGAGVEQRAVPRRRLRRRRSSAARPGTSTTSPGLRRHGPGLERQTRAVHAAEPAVEQPHVAHARPSAAATTRARRTCRRRRRRRRPGGPPRRPSGGRRPRGRRGRAAGGGPSCGEAGPASSVSRSTNTAPGRCPVEVAVVAVRLPERPADVEQHRRLGAGQRLRPARRRRTMTRVPRHAGSSDHAGPAAWSTRRCSPAGSTPGACRAVRSRRSRTGGSRGRCPPAPRAAPTAAPTVRARSSRLSSIRRAEPAALEPLVGADRHHLRVVPVEPQARVPDELAVRRPPRRTSARVR